MVDFDNEVTVGTPAVDIERVSMLQRRYEFIEAYEAHRKRAYSGMTGGGISIVRARLLSLFLEMRPMLKRRWDKKLFMEIEDACYNSTNEMELMNAFDAMNELLDFIHLTKVDTKKVYDSKSPEAENKAKGYD